MSPFHKYLLISKPLFKNVCLGNRCQRGRERSGCKTSVQGLLSGFVGGAEAPGEPGCWGRACHGDQPAQNGHLQTRKRKLGTRSDRATQDPRLRRRGRAAHCHGLCTAPAEPRPAVAVHTELQRSLKGPPRATTPVQLPRSPLWPAAGDVLTCGHEERDAELPTQHPGPQVLQRAPVKGQGAAHQHVEDDAQALRANRGRARLIASEGTRPRDVRQRGRGRDKLSSASVRNTRGTARASHVQGAAILLCSQTLTVGSRSAPSRSACPRGSTKGRGQKGSRGEAGLKSVADSARQVSGRLCAENWGLKGRCAGLSSAPCAAPWRDGGRGGPSEAATYPDVHLGPVVLLPLEELGRGVGGAAAPRLQQLPGREEVTEAKIWKGNGHNWCDRCPADTSTSSLEQRFRVIKFECPM